MKEQEMDVENVGIMQGMADGMDELIEKLLSGEEPLEDGDEDEYETGKMIDRTPSSPEILMNNLRGDMRSVDARREELADMVGYNAAMETPDEVLALLQAQMAQDQMAGIGGLPQAMPPAMPQGAPPMAQGPAPAGGIEALMGGAAPAQPPMQMADGGYVQSFADGSDEDGVTPYGTDTSYSAFPQDMVDLARYETMRTLSRAPAEVPDLRASMEERLPLYQELIGAGDDSRNMTQAQMLFALSQAAFNYAGNVDAQGRPLRGSQLARAAQAFAPVPGQIGALAAAQRKEDRAVKLAALQAAEKDVENVRSANAKLAESQRKIWTEMIKQTGSSPWGKSGIGGSLNIVNTPGLAAKIADGSASIPERNLWFTAYAQLDAKSKPTTESYIDDRGYRQTREIPGIPIPQFVLDATNSYKALISGNVPPLSTAQPEKTIADQVMGKATAVTEAGAEEATTEETGPALPGLTAMATKQAFPEWQRDVTDPYTINPRTHNYLRPGEKTLFNLAAGGKGITGPIPSFLSGVLNIPLIGPVIGDVDIKEARKFADTTVQKIVTALRTNPKFVDKERQEIKAELGLNPGTIDTFEAYLANMYGVQGSLLETLSNAQRTIRSGTANKSDVDDAMKVSIEVHDALRDLGLPIKLQSKTDPVLGMLPLGSVVLYNGQWYPIDKTPGQ